MTLIGAALKIHSHTTLVMGLMLWADGRRFSTATKPPYGLRRWKDITGHLWHTNNEALVARVLDMTRMHKPLSNILLANFFCDESTETLTDVVSMTNINQNLCVVVEVVYRCFGVMLLLFLCGDLHMCRCALACVQTSHCPFC